MLRKILSLLLSVSLFLSGTSLPSAASSVFRDPGRGSFIGAPGRFSAMPQGQQSPFINQILQWTMPGGAFNESLTAPEHLAGQLESSLGSEGEAFQRDAAQAILSAATDAEGFEEFLEDLQVESGEVEPESVAQAVEALRTIRQRYREKASAAEQLLQAVGGTAVVSALVSGAVFDGTRVLQEDGPLAVSAEGDPEDRSLIPALQKDSSVRMPFDFKTAHQNSDLTMELHQGNGDSGNALAMAVQYSPIAALRKSLSEVIGRPLDFFKGWNEAGEAHVTVIHPAEYESTLKGHVSMEEIGEIARKNNIQQTELQFIGVGRGEAEIDGRTEETYFLLVKARQLRVIRQKVYEKFVENGGDKDAWNPGLYFPHITIGFTLRDLHESDGVTKDTQSSFDERFKLVQAKKGLRTVDREGPEIPERLQGLSQAQRIAIALEEVAPSQRQALFEELASDENPDALMQAIEEGTKEALPAVMQSLWGTSLLMPRLLFDLVGLGISFPGVFGLANADQTVGTILESLQKQEKMEALENPDLLRSGGMAFRLKTSMDDNILTVIQQANREYEGSRWGRGRWMSFWYGVKMWFLPPYKRVKRQVAKTHYFQRQLLRYKLIDSLVIRLGLGEAIGLKLTEEEVDALAGIVLDSPQQIEEIEQAYRHLFHRDFTVGDFVPMGGFDIYGIDRRISKFDFEAFTNAADDADLRELGLLAEVLNKAWIRTGRGPRTLSRYSLDELRLYFGAYERGVGRYRGEYFGYTDWDSNESYTVEDKHTMTVPSGTDSKGRTTFRTVTWYTSRTVVPDFENILGDSFDTGDRGVWGLNSIRNRAQKMVAQEVPFRNLIHQKEKFFDFVFDNYHSLVTTGFTKGKGKKRKGKKDIATVERQIEEVLAELEEAIELQRRYVQWSDADIERQYDRDNPVNFKHRNGAMLSRLENLRNLLLVTEVMLKKAEIQLYPEFDIWDYSKWLRWLKRYRDRNYLVKTVLVLLAAVGAMTYIHHPPFQLWVNKAAGAVADFFRRLF